MKDGNPNNSWRSLASPVAELVFDPSVGNLRRLVFEDQGRALEPLSTAHWVDREDADLPEGLAPVERHLSGDFFCAPFSVSDIEEAPAHGWSANSAWCVNFQNTSLIEAVLEKPVMGARIHKSIRLGEDSPILFQEHLIEGGSGTLTVAHHPMVKIAGQGVFSCSSKRMAVTPQTPMDPGKNRLTCAVSTADLERFPGTDGGEVDLTALPIGPAHEDFVTLVEAEDSSLGWTAILREVEDDIVFILKDPKTLPVTMLWHSNGGRGHAPWNGKHRGVLGVEDGCAAGPEGQSAATKPNAVSETGVSTFLNLAPGVLHRIAHAMGAIVRPSGWTRVNDVQLAGDQLILTGDTGGKRNLPFPSDFLERKV